MHTREHARQHAFSIQYSAQHSKCKERVLASILASIRASMHWVQTFRGCGMVEQTITSFSNTILTIDSVWCNVKVYSASCMAVRSASRPAASGAFGSARS